MQAKKNESLNLGDIGEFGLVEEIRKKIFPKNKNKFPILVGPGDDAFVAKTSSDFLLVCTKDVLVENIHFKLGYITPRQLGYKAMAVNLSDLAAMGWCVPLYALVGIALPKHTSLDFVRQLYKGMLGIADKYSLHIIGGDTVSSRKDIVISVTLIGKIKKKYLITRSGAKPGDIIMATGTYGDSAAGLFLLQNGIKPRIGFEKYLVNKHIYPKPRLFEAKRLAQSGLVTSMIDSSDGLNASVKFIAQQSNAGAKINIDKIPVSGPLRKLALKSPEINPKKLALSGGEEYELVFTISPGDVSRINKLLPNLTPVGEIVKGKGVSYYFKGRKQSIKTAGFQHF
ncbi:MAG: thiamine-phosphate kinase [Endomicrobiales bacterium]|nr:thiamine-phosphate kinase [Endomicrobiales bacterium]